MGGFITQPCRPNPRRGPQLGEPVCGPGPVALDQECRFGLRDASQGVEQVGLLAELERVVGWAEYGRLVVHEQAAAQAEAVRHEQQFRFRRVGDDGIRIASATALQGSQGAGVDHLHLYVRTVGGECRCQVVDQPGLVGRAGHQQPQMLGRQQRLGQCQEQGTHAQPMADTESAAVVCGCV